MVSASRRTDMLAFQPDRLLAAITGELPFTKVLNPDKIHTLLISTKDFRNILDHRTLKNTCSQCDQVCFNLTITGLGETIIEPNVPNPSVLFERLPELIKFAGDPNRITWCFDPILIWSSISNMDLKLFIRLAQEFATVGVKRVMAMFFYPYRNAKINPSDVPMFEKQNFARQVNEVCVSLDMELSFCHVPGFHRQRCVDLSWFATLHPSQDKTPISHYKKIKCVDSSYCRDAIWDVGWYLPKCLHGCVYCYGKAE
jgi:hypothetical protein